MKCSASYTITVLADGTDGVSVVSITAYYAISSTSDPVPTEGWDINPQTLTPFDRFLWYKEVTTYSDGHSDPETTPIIIGVYGEGAVGVILSSYSWMFSADEFGAVPNSEYKKFKVDVSVVKGGKSLDFDMSITETGITGASISGNSIILSSDSVMKEDSASIKVIATVDEVSYEATITLAKAKQASSKPMYFAWSKSETIFTPKDSNFWILGSSFIFMNEGMIGNIPYQSDWTDDRTKVMKYKTKEYKYLWCKLEEDSEPFLFTGETGETGTYLSFDVSQTEVDCYVDGPLVSDKDIIITAESDLLIKLLIGNKVASSESTEISYTAKASEILGNETSVTITASTEKMSKSYTIKKKSLSLYFDTTISSAQFSYDSKNNPSPAFIAIVNNTLGLSDKNLVKLTVGGEEKSWENNIFSLTPDMIIGRYINIVLSYGNKSSSLLISKIYDGKVEIIEYATNRDPDNHPEGFGLEFGAQTFSFNGQLLQWGDAWTSELPKVTSGEYLWRRSRMSDSDVWNYVRMTGEKGERGEDGKAGEYLGHYTSVPTKKTDGSAITNGDFYLNTSEEGSPKPYKYVSGQWTLITSDSEEWSQIAAATLDDVNNYGGSLLSTSAYYGFFQALAAQTAFVKSLGAEKITLNDGGTIQSENYEMTNGAEGFSIDSEGNVNFNEGTWRGSFANGFSFIPPTNVYIKKTMTQKEAYQVLRKAGVAAGVYEANPPGELVTNTGTWDPNIGDDSMDMQKRSPMIRTGNGFSCLEYDKLEAQCPFITMFSGLMPIDDYYLLAFGTSISTTGATMNVYLTNVDKIAESNWCSISDFDVNNFSSLLSGWENDTQLLYSETDKVYIVYATTVGGKVIKKGTQVSSTEQQYNLYSVSEDGTSLVLDGVLNFPSSSYTLLRWMLPSAYFHKKDGYWETNAWDSNSGGFKHFAILHTTDLLNYTTAKEVTLSYSDSRSSKVIPMDMVLLNDQVFTIVLEDTTIKTDRYNTTYLAYYSASTSSWTKVDENSIAYFTADDAQYIYQMPAMCVHNDIIYGTYSTHDFFSVTTQSGSSNIVFTDLSEIFRSCLTELYSANYKGNAISPPGYAYRKIIYEEVICSYNPSDYNILQKSFAITGEDSYKTFTWDLTGQTGYTSFLVQFTPDENYGYYDDGSYIINCTYGSNTTKYGSGYELLTQDSTSSTLWVNESNTISAILSNSVLTVYLKKEVYAQSKGVIYALSNSSKSTNTKSSHEAFEAVSYEYDGTSYNTFGLLNSSVIIYGKFISTDSSTISQIKITTNQYDLRKYSTNKLWEKITITALSWSETLNGVMLTVKLPDLVYANLVYYPDTKESKVLSPLMFTTDGENISLGGAEKVIPTCQFAEKDGNYIAVTGVNILVKRDTLSHINFKINNIYYKDLVEWSKDHNLPSSYYDSDILSSGLMNLLFTDYNTVPGFFYAEAYFFVYTQLYEGLYYQNRWEDDKKRLFRVDDETIEIDAPVPFFKINKMIVRETDSTYELIPGTAILELYSHMGPVGGNLLPSFLPRKSCFTYDYGSMLALALGVAPNAQIDPIIKIDKNSDELVSASFIWDFPAQLTVNENIKAVVKNDLLNDRLLCISVI